MTKPQPTAHGIIYWIYHRCNRQLVSEVQRSTQHITGDFRDKDFPGKQLNWYWQPESLNNQEKFTYRNTSI